MESRGKIVIISVDEPLTPLETKIVNNVGAILDSLFHEHCVPADIIFSEMLVYTGKVVLALVKEERENGSKHNGDEL
jgi:hypothetical protein